MPSYRLHVDFALKKSAGRFARFWRLASTINWQRVSYKAWSGPGAEKFGRDKKVRAAAKDVFAKLASRPMPGNISGQSSKVES
jgi:hypothetical protein